VVRLMGGVKFRGNSGTGKCEGEKNNGRKENCFIQVDLSATAEHRSDILIRHKPNKVAILWQINGDMFE
jgi:hypothetical protein